MIGGMTQPLPDAAVAVIVRTKDRPTLLPRALRSITEQRFGSYVVVIVNDGGRPEVVERAVAGLSAAHRQRVHVLHNTTSLGCEGASNVGVAGSRSTYLAIHDDDDTWHPDFLSRCVEHLDDSDDLGVAARCEVVHERIAGGVVTEQRRELLAPDKSAITLVDMVRRNYAPPISMLLRRSAVEQVGGFDPTLPVLGDWDFLLKVLARGTVGFLDGQPLAYWHHRTQADVATDTGNTVVVAGDAHAQFDAVVRDRFARRYLAGEAGPDARLGPLLFAGLAEVHEAERTHAAVAHLAGQIAATTAAQEQLNRSLVSQNNRLVARALELEGQLEQLRALVYSQTPRARLASYRRVARDRTARLLRGRAR